MDRETYLAIERDIEQANELITRARDLAFREAYKETALVRPRLTNAQYELGEALQELRAAEPP